VVAVALVAVGASWAASSARAAGGNVVSFGYADSERADAVHFPTPWAGDPGVIFEGCQPNGTTITKCVFDSSAIKIDNNTGSDETVNSVVVDFPGAAAGGADCMVDIWPHNVTLPAGDTMILAQTNASPTETGTCNSPAGDIDGSEMGPNGVDWGGQTHCGTNSGIIPKVILTINGGQTTVPDTSQVLNTGGTDKANCPTRINPPHQNNESETWGCVNGGQTLTLSPPTQTWVVGQTATITATLDNTCGGPIQGANVAFDDLSGPDIGLTGSGITDANGQATLSYTSPVTGTDTWDSDVVNPAGTVTSNDVNVIWIAPVSQITPTGTTCAQYRDATASTLAGLHYTTKGGLINAATPGVFFYYTRVSGTAGQTVGITQTNNATTAASIPILNGQVVLYNASTCQVKSWTHTVTGGTATGTLPASGNWIIGVKYNTSGLKGTPVPNPATVTYSFGTTLDGTAIPADAATIGLAP
jgi:hypothetical protein